MSKEAMKLAQAVIDAARAAMDSSFEAGNEQMDISIPAHLAAALSLCLDECDREALAEQPAIKQDLTPEQPLQHQEPVALGYMNAGHVHEMQQGRLPYGYVYPKGGAGANVAIYTSPPAQRTWVGLTNEEIEKEWVKMCGPQSWARHKVYARTIEAKLKEKNQ